MRRSTDTGVTETGAFDTGAFDTGGTCNAERNLHCGRRRLLRYALAAAVMVPVVACGSSTGSKAGSNDESGVEGSNKTVSAQLASVELAPVGGAPKLQLGEPSKLPRVVNLWATWCPPCRKELPDFEAVSVARSAEVTFVGIDIGEDVVSAEEFARKIGLTFDQYVDEQSEVQTILGVTSMPSTAFFNADGTMMELHSGALSKADLEAKVDELVKAG